MSVAQDASPGDKRRPQSLISPGGAADLFPPPLRGSRGKGVRDYPLSLPTFSLGGGWAMLGGGSGVVGFMDGPGWS